MAQRGIAGSGDSVNSTRVFYCVCAASKANTSIGLHDHRHALSAPPLTPPTRAVGQRAPPLPAALSNPPAKSFSYSNVQPLFQH